MRARKEVIVSSGAVASAKLLLLSGIGPKDDLQKLGIDLVADLPVGQYLQDHIMAILGYEGGDKYVHNCNPYAKSKSASFFEDLHNIFPSCLSFWPNFC